MNRPAVTLKTLREKVELLVYWMNGVRTVVIDGGATRKITKIPAGHIYKNYALAESQTEDRVYPKASVALDGGLPARGVSGEMNERIAFDVILIFKDVTPGRSTENSQVYLMMENAADDFRFAVESNQHLFDTPGVDSIDITDWTTDSGAGFPEAVCGFKLVVTIRR